MGITLLANYGQDAYTVIKSTNALCIGQVIRDMEEDYDFFNETMNGIPKHYHYTEYVRFLATPITSYVEVMAILEVMGLVKCFRHPNIVMERRALAWRGNAECAKEGVGVIGKKLENVLKLTFCRQYKMFMNNLSYHYIRRKDKLSKKHIRE